MSTGLQLQLEKAAPSTARGCFIYIHGMMIAPEFISILAELAHSFAGVIVPEEYRKHAPFGSNGRQRRLCQWQIIQAAPDPNTAVIGAPVTRFLFPVQVTAGGAYPADVDAPSPYPTLTPARSI